MDLDRTCPVRWKFGHSSSGRPLAARGPWPAFPAGRGGERLLGRGGARLATHRRAAANTVATSPPAPTVVLERTLHADPGEIGGVRRALERTLVNRRVAEPVRAAVRVAASEALANAMIHGRGDVYVRATYSRAAIEIEVRDHGPLAMALEERPPSDAGRAGGLGLYLIDALMDRVEIGVWHERGMPRGIRVRMAITLAP